MHVRNGGRPQGSVVGASQTQRLRPGTRVEGDLRGPAPLATFDTRIVDGCAVVTVRGEIDVSSAATLRHALVDGLERSAFVVVDLSQVTFFDCAGLSVLAAGLRATRAAGGELRLVVGAARLVTRILSLTGLEQVFMVEESVEHAVASLASR